MIKTDLLTGEKFEAQRINQNFANPQNRIKYYNQKANQLRYDNAFVNKPLHKNVCILNELLCDKKEIVIHKQFLSGRNFHFGVHTHYEEYNGKRHFALYQYTVIPIENDQIKIIKR